MVEELGQKVVAIIKRKKLPRAILRRARIVLAAIGDLVDGREIHPVVVGELHESLTDSTSRHKDVIAVILVPVGVILDLIRVAADNLLSRCRDENIIAVLVIGMVGQGICGQ
ncbi:hypothetical protein [Acidithiobacillus sp.]